MNLAPFRYASLDTLKRTFEQACPNAAYLLECPLRGSCAAASRACVNGSFGPFVSFDIKGGFRTFAAHARWQGVKKWEPTFKRSCVGDLCCGADVRLEPGLWIWFLFCMCTKHKYCCIFSVSVVAMQHRNRSFILAAASRKWSTHTRKTKRSCLKLIQIGLEPSNYGTHSMRRKKWRKSIAKLRICMPFLISKQSWSLHACYGGAELSLTDDACSMNNSFAPQNSCRCALH